MRRGLVASLLLAWLAVVQLMPALAAIVADYAPTGSQAVVDGVTHEWGTSQTDLATQQVNVLRIAHDAADVRFDLGLPTGIANARQRTSVQAVAASSPGHRVVAAVNGDFWQTQDAPAAYAPVGLDVRGGELVSGDTAGDRGAIGFKASGVAIVGSPKLTVTVTLPSEATATAAGVNRIRHADELVLYTPRYGVSTATDATGIEVVLAGATLPVTASGTYTTTVAQVVSGVGNTPIAEGQLVLSATGTAAAALETLVVDDGVTIGTTIDDGWADVQTAVGGLLLYTPDETPDLTDPKYAVPNPRTAAGITADGDVLLMTVDGRSETSGGMVLTDVVPTMRSMGAVAAVNLDGGGSTTMVVDPAGDAPLAVANTPSDGHERRVNTTLQVVSTAPDPRPTVSAPAAEIVAGVAAGKSDASVRLAWTASNPAGVANTELQRLGGDGDWHDVALSDPRADSVTVRFRYGKTNQYRVRVTNGDGATSDWATSAVYVLSRYNENSTAVVKTGKWQIQSRSTAIGGRLGRSPFDGKVHVLSLDFSSAQVAVVAQKSKNAGVAEIRIGGTTALVDTNSAATRPRIVVFVGTGDSIAVANAASRAHPNVDIDAFLVLTAR